MKISETPTDVLQQILNKIVPTYYNLPFNDSDGLRRPRNADVNGVPFKDTKIYKTIEKELKRRASGPLEMPGKVSKVNMSLDKESGKIIYPGLGTVSLPSKRTVGSEKSHILRQIWDNLYPVIEFEEDETIPQENDELNNNFNKDDRDYLNKQRRNQNLLNNIKVELQRRGHDTLSLDHLLENNL